MRLKTVNQQQTGTPDYATTRLQTLGDDTATARDRDTIEQKRVPNGEL